MLERGRKLALLSSIQDCPNIFLVGFMAAGKSTVGPLLSRALNREFFDLDLLVMQKEKMSLSEIFYQKGLEYFRTLEALSLKEICRDSQQIIALGGGTLLSEENRNVVRASGVSVYLRYRLETLTERLCSGSHFESRPLLRASNEKDRLLRIQSLYEVRQPIYEEAEIVVDSDGKSPDQIMEEIKKWI